MAELISPRGDLVELAKMVIKQNSAILRMNDRLLASLMAPTYINVVPPRVEPSVKGWEPSHDMGEGD